MSQFLATKMISTSSFASSNKGLINSVYALAGPEIKGSSFSVDRSFFVTSYNCFVDCMTIRNCKIISFVTDCSINDIGMIVNCRYKYNVELFFREHVNQGFYGIL